MSEAVDGSLTMFSGDLRMLQLCSDLRLQLSFLLPVHYLHFPPLLCRLCQTLSISPHCFQHFSFILHLASVFGECHLVRIRLSYFQVTVSSALSVCDEGVLTRRQVEV